jgi:copper transport protein
MPSNITPAPPPRHRRARHRRAARVLLVALAAILLLLAVPGRAMAHPTLLYTTPAAETADPTAPDTVALVFGEPVTIGQGALTLLSAQGQPVPLGAATTAKQGHAVTARIPQKLPVGVYTVRWRVTGVDGDLVEGQFRFAVGAAITGTGAAGSAAGISWPTAVLRWLLFAALALALGGLIGEWIVRSGRAVNAALPPLRSWVVAASAGGAAAAVGLAGLQVADAGRLAALVDAGSGRVLTVEAVGFILAAAVAASRRARWWSAIPLAAVVVAEGVRAHPNVAVPGWGAVLTGVHVVAAAVWVGALVTVVRAVWVWRVHRAARTWLVSTYARLAAWLFAAVITTGIVEALLLVPVSALLSTTYGRLLLVKLGLVVLAAALALTARRLMRRGPAGIAATARAARVEAGALGAVLAVTAVLVSAAPPGAASGQLPGPPPPTGVVLPLGTLAGQVGVGVQASAGRVVVHLAAPSRGDYYATTPTTQAFGLTGRLKPVGGRPRDVVFRGCGTGCFLADVAWAGGDNLLTLHATATGWHGGTASLLVPWPVQPAPQQLTRAVAAMRTAGQLTAYEQVTSDTSTPMPEPTPLSLTGAQFLSTEPYSSGTAPQIVALPAAAAGQIRVAMGFPAEARYVQLTLDETGRIVDEVQSDPKHLTRRHFTYPEAAP